MNETNMNETNMNETNMNETNMNETYNGWYSEKQSKFMKKSFLYENLKGVRYVVTEVKKDEEKPLFDDVVFMGKVTKFIKAIEHC